MQREENLKENKYRNTKTGRVITVTSEIVGGLWEKIEEKAEKKDSKKE